MSDVGSELTSPAPSVLENPRMQQLIEDLGIEQGDLAAIESLGRFPSERYAEFFHNRFNRDHEKDAIPTMERDLVRSTELLDRLPEDSLERIRVQDSHDIYALSLPLLRRYGRTALYRLATFLEYKDDN